MDEFLAPFYSLVASSFELLGVTAMVGGAIIAIILAYRSLRRGENGKDAYKVLRTTIGGAILLGLEILVAADLVRTITSDPTMEEVLVLGLIVVIRTVLSMSISIEIEGVLPWKKALLQSGASVIAGQVKNDRAKAQATPDSAPEFRSRPEA
ncbi:MAG: DUF1622 domain-containing protein [Scrofimicrobium sp.]